MSRAYGRNAPYQTAIDDLNRSRAIMEECVLNTHHQEAFQKACVVMRVSAPSQHFALHPINSPAVLLFWRCIIHMLGHCTDSQRAEFRAFRGSSQSPDPELQPSEQLEPVSSEEEVVPDTLEGFVVVDETSEDSEGEIEDMQNPAIIDSHFHLDQTSQRIWNESHGPTVEAVVYQPRVPVR